MRLQASSTMHLTAWHQGCYQLHRRCHAEHRQSTSAWKATSGASGMCPGFVCQRQSPVRPHSTF